MMKDAAKKALQTGAKQAQSPLIPTAVTSMVQGAIKAAVVSSKTTKRNKTVSSQQPKVEQLSNSQKIYGAALNLKVEQSKVLEQKIKELRALNTQEAREAADIIEEEMKKLCESDLSKLDIQKIEEKVLTYAVNKVTEKMREPGDAIISAGTGFLVSVVLNPIEFAGGMLSSMSYTLRGKDAGEGYANFSGKVDSLKRIIEENVPNKKAYYVGNIGGDILQFVVGVTNIVSGPSGLSDGIQMVSNGGEAALALTETAVGIEGYIGKAVESTIALASAGNGMNDVDNVSGDSKKIDEEGKGIPDKVYDILNEIEHNNGTPPNGYKGGKIFQNANKKLPEGATYKEYDVNPHITGKNRGTERIVIGNDGTAWYTNDHYETFVKIK